MSSFAPTTTKLADSYGSNGSRLNDTPLLFSGTVILKRSVSPVLSSSPKDSSRRKRHIQPSQADEVLISHMGNHNLPDIATTAGQEPLSSASQSEIDEEEIMQTASNGQDAVDDNDRSNESSQGSTRPEPLGPQHSISTPVRMSSSGAGHDDAQPLVSGRKSTISAPEGLLIASNTGRCEKLQSEKTTHLSTESSSSPDTLCNDTPSNDDNGNYQKAVRLFR